MILSEILQTFRIFNIHIFRSREGIHVLYDERHKLLNIKHKQSSPYHPESNGALERSHLTLKVYLKCYVNKDGNNWDEFKNFAVYAYNTSILKATAKTPYKLVFGQEPRVSTNVMKPPNKTTYSDLVRNLNTKLRHLRKTARDLQISTKQKSKAHYDRTHSRKYPLKEGGLVLLHNGQAKQTSKQLKFEYRGPYEIVQVRDTNKSASIKQSNNKIQTYHFSILKPYVADPRNKQDEEGEDE